jgi:hypothetical protein
MPTLSEIQRWCRKEARRNDRATALLVEAQRLLTANGPLSLEELAMLLGEIKVWRADAQGDQ